MSRYRETFDAEESPSWTWHIFPLLIVAAALSALFVPRGTEAVEESAAQTAPIEAPHHAMLLTPSPQPGAGHPELRAVEISQSY